jgi:hypothetical protein
LHFYFSKNNGFKKFKENATNEKHRKTVSKIELHSKIPFSNFDLFNVLKGD